LKEITSSQWKLNLGFSLFMLLLIVLLMQVSIQLALIFALSLALGFTLQRSRFCTASAFRDPILVGTTKLTQAFILLLAISIMGFAVVANGAEILKIPLKLNVFPLGIHTIIGGILFGIGMVLAGGCVSGVLTRIGEGFAMQMFALLGLLFGTAFGGYSSPYIRSIFGEFSGVFLPDIFGWLPSVAIQLLILLILWEVTRWWHKKQNGVG